MRILVVCTSTEVFGAEIMSLNILRALQRRGHDLLAVTTIFTNGEFSRRLQVMAVEEVALPLGALAKPLSLRAIKWTLHTLIYAPSLWAGWRRTLRKFSPDVVLLTNPKQGLWLYPWLRWQPTFLLEHSMKAASRANRWMYRKLDESLAQFIPVSRFMRTHLEDLHVSAERARVIYNCIQPVESPGPQTRETAPGTVSFGIVGQISPHKGHDRLLEASQLLRARGVSFKIKVFGSGKADYVARLKERIVAADLTDIWEWMNYASNPVSIYHSIDVCVVPSQFDEPFGMVALEASSFGLPVIASQRGGLPEIVEDGITGFLVPSESSAELANRMEWLIKNLDAAREMGAAGREKATGDFSEDKMVSAYEDLFTASLRSNVQP